MSQPEKEEREPAPVEKGAPRPRSRRRRIVLNAAVLFASLAGALLVAEFFASRVLSRPAPRTRTWRRCVNRCINRCSINPRLERIHLFEMEDTGKSLRIMREFPGPWAGAYKSIR